MFTKFVLPFLIVCLAAAECWAEGGSPYCRKVQARASKDAALLIAPTLTSQGFRFPTNTQDPLLATAGGALQLRVGMSWSLTDIYKGTQVLGAADTDCDRHKVQAEIDDLLPQLR